jgi:hypothetical protein
MHEHLQSILGSTFSKNLIIQALQDIERILPIGICSYMGIWSNAGMKRLPIYYLYWEIWIAEVFDS